MKRHIFGAQPCSRSAGSSQDTIAPSLAKQTALRPDCCPRMALPRADALQLPLPLNRNCNDMTPNYIACVEIGPSSVHGHCPALLLCYDV